MARVEEFLKEQKEKNLLRILHKIESRKGGRIYIDGNEYVDFSSNDYLGLTQHPRLIEAAATAAKNFGVGSCASRLLSGDLEIHHQLEEKTAAFKKTESALVFNSGYQANIGIISALCKGGDVIFFDRLCHASIIDGVMLSGARFFSFRHNDLAHLEELLKKERDKFKSSLMITETLFSMDGDKAPLKGLAALKEKYNSMLMADEAHATGIFGKNGTGLVEEEGLSGRIDLIMGTFSKALGSFGAYLCCSEEMKNYLINSCRSFIYSTALPPAVIAANIISLDLVKEEPFRRKTLLENADFFHRQLQGKGFEVLGESQIIPLIIGESEKAVGISRELRKRGHWVLPIRPPTVAPGKARLRISLTYNHTKNDLGRLIDDLCRQRS
jgi:8-amino-7-oxononanoate synthase